MTLLCDSGARYASKLFNPAFLRSKSLPVPDWLEAKTRAPKVFAEMTQALFRDDAYRTETEAIVLMSEPRGIALDRTVFYPQGGGQSGDRGTLLLDDGAAIPIVNTVYDSDRATILHVPAGGRGPAPPGRARDRPHRLGPALQAHARPYRAASALGRGCPIR